MDIPNGGQNCCKRLADRFCNWRAEGRRAASLVRGSIGRSARRLVDAVVESSFCDYSLSGRACPFAQFVALTLRIVASGLHFEIEWEGDPVGIASRSHQLSLWHAHVHTEPRFHCCGIRQGDPANAP